MTVYDLMLEVKAQLQGVAGIATVDIGLEPSIRPADYPLIRIVSGNNSRAEYLYENMDFIVYFGDNIQDKVGMEGIYQALYGFEKIIRERLDTFQPSGGGLCKWVRTESDEDRLSGYKILASRFVVEGA